MVKFTATGIYRNNLNFINSVLPDARGLRWSDQSADATNDRRPPLETTGRVGRKYVIEELTAGSSYLAPDGTTDQAPPNPPALRQA